ncbi:hypothetical protein DQ04_03131020 [Trypanosoma grayi]|uniref:hypothetical protein n=1 Tax=Trypanosoma grayi TaxID=71804 RepID=UPI0004F41CD6|nr:hypothetical protein DQ04_03131020 [Trypanosoma grayi]KEG10941.1 hypothetical protein DQ04_03131020 [Trypanosoma grayi]
MIAVRQPWEKSLQRRVAFQLQPVPEAAVEVHRVAYHIRSIVRHLLSSEAFGHNKETLKAKILQSQQVAVCAHTQPRVAHQYCKAPQHGPETLQIRIATHVVVVDCDSGCSRSPMACQPLRNAPDNSSEDGD